MYDNGNIKGVQLVGSKSMKTDKGRIWDLYWGIFFFFLQMDQFCLFGTIGLFEMKDFVKGWNGQESFGNF